MRTAIAVCLAALPAWSAAQDRVSQTRPAAADGVVQIESPAGSIRVIGWDRSEVAVSGTLGSGATGLDLSGDKRHTRVEVESDGNPHGVSSDLEVRVPAGSEVSIESFGASISVSDVKGMVTAETVNGDIQIGEAPREVQAESVNGGVTVAARGGRVHAESVNGPVSVRGAGGEVDASTVNGPLNVTGGPFERARLETVNGRVLFEAGLTARGTLEVETVSGAVELALPGTTSADFSVVTFSGDVRNELGPPARATSEHTTEKELTFSTGGGGANVSVETLSGSIVLRRR
jgi:putative adhesin